MAEEPRDTPFSMERAVIRTALEEAHRDNALATRLLGISQAKLRRRMGVCGLGIDDAQEE